MKTSILTVSLRGSIFIAMALLFAVQAPVQADIIHRKKPAVKKVHEPNIFERIHNFVANMVDKIDPIDPDEQPYPLPPRSVYERDRAEHEDARRAASKPRREEGVIQYRRIDPVTGSRFEITVDPTWNEPNRSGLAPTRERDDHRPRVDADESFRRIPPISSEEMEAQRRAAEQKPEVRPERKPPVVTDETAAPRKEKPTEQAAKPSQADVPVAEYTNTPGRVKSPFPPYRELDVTGLAPGSMAKDPTTGRVFRLPK